MSKASADEAKIPGDRAAQAAGSPDKSQRPVSDTLPPGMSMPSAPGEQNMGGVKKSMASGSEQNDRMGNSTMGAAVAQLNYETERGSHAPGVGGHSDAGLHHTGSGVIKKD